VDERLKASIKAGDGEAVARLLHLEPSLAADHDEVRSAVMLAAFHQQPEIAHALLEARGPADLFEAAALGLEARVRAFMGWNPGCVVARSPDGFTALHLAAFFGHAGIVRCLLGAGVDVEPIADNASEVRPLHSAVAGGSGDVVDLLLAAGADANARQSGGFTPLMGAAAAGAATLARSLMDAGADRDARSDDGKTAADLARDNGHEGLVALLAH
jgi:ankyrin repeat protein